MKKYFIICPICRKVCNKLVHALEIRANSKKLEVLHSYCYGEFLASEEIKRIKDGQVSIR